MQSVDLNTDSKIDFNQIANYILNRCVLVCNGHILRICELEFYLKCESHNDPYVHDSPEQRTYGSWYFHKHHTGTYKGGTFKGLDITFGSSAMAFSILIRSIYCPGDSIVEGPCKTVNKLLQLLEVKSIIDFTQGKLLSINHNKLKLVEASIPASDAIVKGPRIGLSNKNVEYQNKEYRFAISRSVKKNAKSLH